MALALGSSTPVEEARTAAMAALRLIEGHRLLDAAAPPPRAAPPVADDVMRCTCEMGFIGSMAVGRVRSRNCPIHGERT